MIRMSGRGKVKAVSFAVITLTGTGIASAGMMPISLPDEGYAASTRMCERADLVPQEGPSEERKIHL
jgi:hypothetical protein